MERGTLSPKTFSELLDADIPEAGFMLELVHITKANTSPFVLNQAPAFCHLQPNMC